MPLIEREFIAPKKGQLNIRVDPDVMETLERYAEFLSSGQNYVVEQALRYLFAKDRDFANWLATSRVSDESEASTNSTNRKDS